MEGHEFVVGEFAPNLPTSVFLHHIWPKVCAIPSWPDQMPLFFTLCIISKTWNDLVDHIKIGPIASSIFLSFDLKTKIGVTQRTKIGRAWTRKLQRLRWFC
jgi:hypothetical protein